LPVSLIKRSAEMHFSRRHFAVVVAVVACLEAADSSQGMQHHRPAVPLLGFAQSGAVTASGWSRPAAPSSTCTMPLARTGRGIVNGLQMMSGKKKSAAGKGKKKIGKGGEEG